MEITQMNQWLRSIAQVGLVEQLINMAVFVILCLAGYYLVNIGNKYVPANKKLKFRTEQLKLIFFVVVVFLVLSWIYTNAGLFLSLLMPFIIAAVISYAFNPLIVFLTGKKISRTLSVVIFFLSCLLIGAILSVTVIPRMVTEVRQLIERLPTISSRWYNNLSEWFSASLAGYSFTPDSLDEVFEFFDLDLNTLTDWLSESAGDLFLGITTLVSNIVLIVTIPVLTFYFMKDGEQIMNLTKKSVPPANREWVFGVFSKIDHVLGGFIRGRLLVSLFVGIMCGLALLFLGVDFWIILGVIAGITNIIPYLGPFIGAVPAVLMTLAVNPSRTIWVVLVYVIVQQVESSIISPKIVGDRVGLHPALIILSLLVAGSLAGIVGLLVAVPLAAIIKIIIMEVVSWFKKRFPGIYTDDDKKSPEGKEDEK